MVLSVSTEAHLCGSTLFIVCTEVIEDAKICRVRHRCVLHEKAGVYLEITQVLKSNI